jgi:hypothetical protein
MLFSPEYRINSLYLPYNDDGRETANQQIIKKRRCFEVVRGSF